MIDPAKRLCQAYSIYPMVISLRISCFHFKITLSCKSKYRTVSYLMTFSILKQFKLFPILVHLRSRVQVSLLNCLSLLINLCDVLSFFDGDFGIGLRNESLLNCSIAWRLFILFSCLDRGVVPYCFLWIQGISDFREQSIYWNLFREGSYFWLFSFFVLTC